MKSENHGQHFRSCSSAQLFWAWSEGVRCTCFVCPQVQFFKEDLKSWPEIYSRTQDEKLITGREAGHTRKRELFESCRLLGIPDREGISVADQSLTSFPHQHCLSDAIVSFLSNISLMPNILTSAMSFWCGTQSWKMIPPFGGGKSLSAISFSDRWFLVLN